MCGGSGGICSSTRAAAGLSPRVRGKRSRGSDEQPGRGSIPACAGEAGAETDICKGKPVYPRVCGGSRPSGAPPGASPGLSPRVRGKRNIPVTFPGRVGSIPACAGEASPYPQTPYQSAVYPRVCGGSFRRNHHSLGITGLSPRVRGKLNDAAAAIGCARSIPACAGEAFRAFRLRVAEWVYPRVCGGSILGRVQRFIPGGLSPRVRGKPAGQNATGGVLRSIPACAGEARHYPPPPAVGEVYPRVCGGSIPGMRWPPPRWGLSPRVRGKRHWKSRKMRCSRSIPACAGEAGAGKRNYPQRQVYPRVCGGSQEGGLWGYRHGGLSPRVRGKLERRVHHQHIGRSIPACAGEAARNDIHGYRRQVYPRVCGGSP